MNFTIGQYYPGVSVIHRLNAQSKLIMTILYIIFIFFARSIWGYGIAAAYVLVGIYLSQISLRVVLRGLRPILFIVVFTLVLNLFTYGGGFGFTMVGLYAAIRLAIRLILLVMGSQLLTLTTQPLDLTDGLEKCMKPLAVVHFPVHDIAMMMSIALRFIPTLMDEADRIMKAQKSRGADFESGNLMKRVWSMVPLLVPLFVSAVHRADELAIAMEARCYHGGEGRTRMKQTHMKGIDAVALGITAAVCGLLLADMLIFGGG